MASSVWQLCVDKLQDELTPQQFNTWIRPLQVYQADGTVQILAPNRYVKNKINSDYLERIMALLAELDNADFSSLNVQLDVGNLSDVENAAKDRAQAGAHRGPLPKGGPKAGPIAAPKRGYGPESAQPPLPMPSSTSASTPLLGGADPYNPYSHDDTVDALGEVDNFELKPSGSAEPSEGQGPMQRLQQDFTFDSFVQGTSNELAFAAASQVAANAGRSYNPLLLYGGVGLGKTHLMQAVGNAIRVQNPRANVVYVHSQRFVQDMVNALQRGTMHEFAQYYRSIDALLIDDIQFFAKKLRSQEEFFNVFNGLLEADHQMILTCDRYPREIDGLEERLKSRFVWGLTVEVEPPELETRVAILMKKAEAEQIELDPAVAFYMAERIRSNVRELEGALRRVIANARFTGQAITQAQVARALRDLFAIQERQVGIPNIQKAVSEYYNIKISDLLSKRRSRTIARPRQMAMFLAKELTSHSLPEIGDAFGGRDHTTVIHACRKIKELKESTPGVAEDYRNLSRLVSQ